MLFKHKIISHCYTKTQLSLTNSPVLSYKLQSFQQYACIMHERIKLRVVPKLDSSVHYADYQPTTVQYINF